MELLNKAQAISKAFNEKISELQNEIGVDFHKNHIENNKELVSFPKYIKIGNLINDVHTFPCLLESSQLNGIAFYLNETNREEVNLTMEHVVLQILEQMKDEYCEVTLMDPMHLGANFRNLRRLHKKILKEKVFEEEALNECMNRNYQDSVRVINECLTNFKDLNDYNTNSGNKQKLRIIVISDFPHYFRNCMKVINTILTNAKDGGVLMLMSINEEINPEYFKDEFDSIVESLATFREFNEAEDLYKLFNFNNKKFYNEEFTIKLDRRDINPDHVTSKVLEINKKYVEKENKDSSDGGLRIPIGKCEGITFYFTFGHDTDNYSAIIGGQSGKGKTVLLNNIIAKGIEAYDEDELTYGIIDCSGVGYQYFNNSNRVSYFESSSDQLVCFKKVQELNEELKRREALFKKAKVENIDRYNEKCEEKLPRLVIVVDEFHVLFSENSIRIEDEDGYLKELIDVPNAVEEILITRIVRIGRKFGVHLILSTQSLDGIPYNILNNISLRIALGMNKDQSITFLGHRNDAAENLDAGIAIYNTKNGDPNFNKRVKVYHIKEEEIERINNL